MHYPGGKGGTYQRLINLMPAHDVYIETHLGGGAVIRHKRPANNNIGIEIDPDVINRWQNEVSIEMELIHGDSIRYLKEYQFLGNELVYCDPPYLRSSRKKRARIYKYEYTLEQHIDLLKTIKRLPCMVMISSYESELYREYLSGWNTYSFQSAAHNEIATELVWMNYPSPIQLHDYRFLGDNFRERERIKRKSKRWVAKLKSMPVLERQALFSAIDSIK